MNRLIKAVAVLGCASFISGCGDVEGYEYAYEYEHMSRFKTADELHPYVVKLAKARKAESAQDDLDDIEVNEQELVFAACTIDHLVERADGNTPQEEFDSVLEQATTRFIEIYVNSPQNVINRPRPQSTTATALLGHLEKQCLQLRPA